ncbi:DUF72 domain-containing protein [Caulobacter sp. SLTY]|uniref:DUF72 domain-containing protein n=1 Tax=Caulobacter sp. SLTY TaxID=2683262 RepID=UPI00196AAB8B|nr:DUF72 domain-containing protein [Caulobacter sp. SLTY]
MTGAIRTGCGGWTFEPWRGVFFPPTVKQKDELRYMSSQLRSIEINGTYYSTFKPDSWKKWRDETPDDFVFTVKGSRFTTNRKVLSEAGESLERFLNQGLTELGPKLGPIFWQFAHTKKFDPEDFEGFLKLLPKSLDGLALRHAVEVRHDSFCSPDFAALLRKHGVACVYAKHEKYPEIADVTADFVYARLQTGSDDCETAYPPAELDDWAGRLKTWAAGGVPADLPLVDPGHTPEPQPRDVFAFIIHEGKVRAPHGAAALQSRVGDR